MKFKFLFLLLLFPLGELFGKDQPKIRFRSRGLFDIGIQDHNGAGTKSYYKIEDLRAGFKASFKRYEINADIGIGNSKVTIKDLLFSYKTQKSTITFGNAYEPFGMDMLISTYDLRFNQSASSILAITSSRRIGITYHFHSDRFYAATGVYSDNDINKSAFSAFKQAFAFTSRGVWRPVMDDNRLLHIGAAVSFRTTDKAFRTTKIGTYGIASFPGDNIASCEVSSAKNTFKTCFELLFSCGRFALQSEYLSQHITRTTTELPTYSAHGGYAMLCVIAMGSGYGYDRRYAIPERPDGASAVEITAGINFLTLNDRQANIYGGNHKSVSLGVNYYINRYIAVKFSSSYITSDAHRNNAYRSNYVASQLRLQYLF